MRPSLCHSKQMRNDRLSAPPLPGYAPPRIIPSPEPAAALQMHPTQPPIDPTGRDPIEFA